MPPVSPASAMTDPQTLLSDLRAGRLAGVTRLDLRHAGLHEFPPELFTLADSLETLDLSSNHLQALPADLHRLHRLHTLFCSNNRFSVMPERLGQCESLDIVGFKANLIEHVPAGALPAHLRWLILTDNRVEALPETLAGCTRMQKLMLAGNRLRALPVGIGALRRLELVRLAANRFERLSDALPAELLALPRLSWVAFAGNPFDAERDARQPQARPIRPIAWADLHLGELLGEGASGVIHAARWEAAGSAPQAVAVKRFKGAMTSDGLPRSEMAACIAAGAHPHLVGVEGRLADHPEGAQGLVMRRIPAGYRNLAGPPSMESCTRDVYDEALRFTVVQARALASGIGLAMIHLHERGVLHGDLYAHNILVDDASHGLLGDFGAASFLPTDDDVRAEALKRCDRRALGVLVDELARRCPEPSALDDLRPAD
jgi:hypothetical protein